jgi:hypothetical protein
VVDRALCNNDELVTFASPVSNPIRTMATAVSPIFHTCPITFGKEVMNLKSGVIATAKKDNE